LQDERGRVLIDHCGALGTADVGCDQFPLDGGG
jgi:hypothetical protein